MPLVDIDQDRLDALAALISQNIDALVPGSVAHNVAGRFLLSDAAMVAFVIDRHLRDAAAELARTADRGS